LALVSLDFLARIGPFQWVMLTPWPLFGSRMRGGRALAGAFLVSRCGHYSASAFFQVCGGGGAETVPPLERFRSRLARRVKRFGGAERACRRVQVTRMAQAIEAASTTFDLATMASAIVMRSSRSCCWRLAISMICCVRPLAAAPAEATLYAAETAVQAGASRESSRRRKSQIVILRKPRDCA
jgi:hypothetical protein